MDILEKKKPIQYKDDIKRIIKLLTYKTKLELKGSASLVSQRFPSDYDFMSMMKRPTEHEFVTFLRDVLNKIKESPDYWFTELKFQSRDKKTKVFPHQLLKEGEVGSWDKLELIKLDMVARIDNRFTEVSVIYSFTDELPTPEEYKKSLEKDITELVSEGNYYKALKRMFNIYKADGYKKGLLRLTKIFNGEMGELYQKISNLEAIQLVLKYYPTQDVIKKSVINLKDIHLPETTDTEAWVKTNKAELNKQAKQLYLNEKHHLKESN